MMRITIRTWAGAERDGVLLCRHGLAMRVAVLDGDDTMEMRFRGGQWFAENGELVEIEFHPAKVEGEVLPWAGDEPIDGARY